MGSGEGRLFRCYRASYPGISLNEQDTCFKQGRGRSGPTYMHTTEIENKTCNMQNKSELALNLGKCTHFSVYLAYDLSSLLGIFEIPSYCYEYHSPTSNNCAVVCAAFSYGWLCIYQTFLKSNWGEVVAAHAWNPRTQDAREEGLLMDTHWVWGQPRLLKNRLYVK